MKDIQTAVFNECDYGQPFSITITYTDGTKEILTDPPSDVLISIQRQLQKQMEGDANI